MNRTPRLLLALGAWLAGAAVRTAAAAAPPVPPAPPALSGPELRCGWFDNPTPGNAWLTDRQAQWVIGIQGGHQADGDWPDIPDAQWVFTNGHYGYGCACLRVLVDPRTHEIQRILHATARPLKACEQDRTLPRRRPGADAAQR